jgi:hypothetical protein
MPLESSFFFRRVSKLATKTIYFIMSVRPSGPMEQLGSHWTEFHEIPYFTILPKSVEKIQLSLKSVNNSGYFI